MVVQYKNDLKDWHQVCISCLRSLLPLVKKSMLESPKTMLTVFVSNYCQKIYICHLRLSSSLHESYFKTSTSPETGPGHQIHNASLSLHVGLDQGRHISSCIMPIRTLSSTC